MLFVPTIVFNRFEAQILQRAFEPIHVLEADFHRFGGAEAVFKLVRFVSDIKAPQPLTIDQVNAAFELLTGLAAQLQGDLAQAHILDWAKGAESGKAVPVVNDPHLVQDVVIETRRYQLRMAMDGVRLLHDTTVFLVLASKTPVPPPSREGGGEPNLPQ